MIQVFLNLKRKKAFNHDQCKLPRHCLNIETRTNPRVRTGYGILEKLWNFENEIPYMEKLWNLSKTAVPMEKLWNFRNGGKECVLSLKNGGKIRPDFEMWFQYLLLRLSLH